jgi:hypothetical protein
MRLGVITALVDLDTFARWPTKFTAKSTSGLGKLTRPNTPACFVPSHEVPKMIDLQKRAQLLRFAQLIMAATIVSGTVVGALASSYPTRAVTIVVPFAAGTVTDTVARLMAEHLRETFGQPFIVENKGGRERDDRRN